MKEQPQPTPVKILGPNHSLVDIKNLKFWAALVPQVHPHRPSIDFRDGLGSPTAISIDEEIKNPVFTNQHQKRDNFSNRH